MQHPEEGTIHAWLDGALDAEEAARVEQHVAECATCAGAVAEARGLIAGASRILSALDDVPAGVTPSASGPLGGASGSRRPRSLWTHFHLTPARAAAAAFLIVAAGTALVMREASEVTHRGVYSMTKQADAPASKPIVPASPQPPAPSIVDSLSVGRGAEARKATVLVHAAADSAGPQEKALPQPAPPKKDLAEQARADLAQVRVTASSNAAPMKDSVARVQTQAPGVAGARYDSARRARPLALSEVVTTSVVGGTAPPSPAPRAARDFARVRPSASYAGCYSVAALGDSLSAIPSLLSLDSFPVNKARADQRSATPSRLPVSAVTAAGYHLIDSASWQPVTDGVLISFGRTPLNLRATADSTLSAAGVAGRGLSVTMQRVDCPRR